MKKQPHFPLCYAWKTASLGHLMDLPFGSVLRGEVVEACEETGLLGPVLSAIDRPNGEAKRALRALLEAHDEREFDRPGGEWDKLQQAHVVMQKVHDRL